VKELVERISAHTQLPGIPIVVTGGGAAWLLTPELFLGRSVFHEPDLVHVGLAHAAIDAWAGAGGARGGS